MSVSDRSDLPVGHADIAGWSARRYRLKRQTPGPVVEATAMQFTGTNTAALIRWLGIDVPASTSEAERRSRPSLSFHPEHPGQVCRHGDWIVRYESGAIVVMTAEQFAEGHALSEGDPE